MIFRAVRISSKILTILVTTLIFFFKVLMIPGGGDPPGPKVQILEILNFVQILDIFRASGGLQSPLTQSCQ